MKKWDLEKIRFQLNRSRKKRLFKIKALIVLIYPNDLKITSTIFIKQINA
jgi:hypothetical protein